MSGFGSRVAFSTLLFVLIIPVLSLAAKAHKPLPPVSITITSEDQSIKPRDIKAGDVVAFVVTASSAIDSEVARVKVELTGGVGLVSGDTVWNGPVRKGQPVSLNVTVRIPSSGKGSIKASVSLPNVGEARYGAQAFYNFGAESNKQSGNRSRKDSKGRSVIESRPQE